MADGLVVETATDQAVSRTAHGYRVWGILGLLVRLHRVSQVLLGPSQVPKAVRGQSVTH